MNWNIHQIVLIFFFSWGSLRPCVFGSYPLSFWGARQGHTRHLRIPPHVRTNLLYIHSLPSSAWKTRTWPGGISTYRPLLVFAQLLSVAAHANLRPNFLPKIVDACLLGAGAAPIVCSKGTTSSHTTYGQLRLAENSRGCGAVEPISPWPRRPSDTRQIHPRRSRTPNWQHRYLTCEEEEARAALCPSCGVGRGMFQGPDPTKTARDRF